MKLEVEDPETVTPESVENVAGAMGDDADVVVCEATGEDRPFLVRVYDGLVHTHRLDGLDVVGVSHSGEYTLIHVTEQ